MKKLVLIILTLALVLAMVIPSAVVYAKPATITVPFNQAQYQWRGNATFGDWSYSYQNWSTSSDMLLIGKVLHSGWDYTPYVTNQRGDSTVYVYDKTDDVWIEKEGAVKYVYEYGYGEYTVVNKFRGYLEFDGAPAADNFLHGVAYQWVYIYAPQNVDISGAGAYTANAYWDDVVNAWLVGFSIYIYDSGAQSYTTPFPTTSFPEPIPARDYNPLEL